jgi:hypothetical protein
MNKKSKDLLACRTYTACHNNVPKEYGGASVGAKKRYAIGTFF